MVCIIDSRYGAVQTLDDKLISRIYRLRDDQSRMFSVCLSPPPSSKLYLTSKQWKWKMRALPPQKNDEMLRVIKTTILELNKQDMLFWNIGLEVSHLTMSPPLWPRHLEEYSTKLYAFKEKHEEFPMAVETTLSRACRYLTADSILVRKKDDMSKPKPGKLLKTWLLSLVNPKAGLGDAGWKLQQDWWASNGQSFPIMNLPAELRREILRQILSGNIYPNTQMKEGMSGPVVTLGSEFQNSPGDCGPESTMSPRPDPPNYAILRVNRQMHYEAQKAAWEGTTKHFSSPMMMGEVMQAPNSPSVYRWLTHIQLCMSTSECFDFFGIGIDPVLRLLPQPSKGRMLQGISTLESLEISFSTPYSFHANPWSRFYLINHHLGWFRNDIHKQGMQEKPCHKIVVEWALALAFPYLKHIPKVRLTGCIKTCTKTKWEQILSNEYYLRKESFKTHGYEPAMEAYDLLEERHLVYRPPTCSCPASCSPNRRPQDLEGFDHDDSYTPPPPRKPPPPSKKSAPVRPGQLWSKLHTTSA